MTAVINRFKSIYFFFYFTFAIFAGFTIPYLNDLNYSNTQIGFMMSILYLFGIIGQSFSGYICDLKRTIKKVFFLWMMILATLIFIFFKLDSIIIQTFFLAFIGFFQSSVMTLLDSWILESTEIIKRSFGPIRAFGSVGWGVSTIIIGRMIDNYGWYIMGYIYIISTITLLMISSKPKDAKCHIHNKSLITIKSFNILRTNKAYVNLLIIFFLLFFAFHAINMFSVILIDNFGGTESDIGLFLLIAAFSEVPLLLSAKKLLKKFDGRFLLIISATFFFLRTLLTAFCNSVLAIILLSLLQMFSLGILIFIFRHLIDKISPSKLKTSSQTIATAVSGGLSAIISYNTSGYLADQIGTKNMLFFVSFLCMLALILSMRYYKQYRVNPKIKINSI